MAEAEGTTITSYSAEQSMQLYDEIFGGYESSGGDLLSGNKPLISSTKLRVNQDEDQIVGQPSTGSFVGSGSIGSGFTNGQGQDVFISSSEDSDGLDISGLNQRSQPSRPSNISVGSRFPTYAQPKEQPQQPGAADVIGGIIGTVLAGQQQTRGGRAKKTTTQKVVERAATQAASTVTREVTKGIMRGIFGNMK